MTASVARLQQTAVLAALTADSALKVYDGKVDDNPVLPYVVVYPDPGLYERNAVKVGPNQVTVAVQTTCVGTTREQAQWVADHVAAALLDQLLTVAGRAMWPITQEAALPLQRDDDIQPPVFYQVAVYRVTSVPG